jgi:hypothetical protein
MKSEIYFVRGIGGLNLASNSAHRLISHPLSARSSEIELPRTQQNGNRSCKPACLEPKHTTTDFWTLWRQHRWNSLAFFVMHAMQWPRIVNRHFSVQRNDKMFKIDENTRAYRSSVIKTGAPTPGSGLQGSCANCKALQSCANNPTLSATRGGMSSITECDKQT